MPKRNWLLSAFEPFLDRSSNHSQEVMSQILKLNTDPELILHTVILPTEYDRCNQVLIAEIKRLQGSGITVEGVLSLGEGKDDFKIETRANNLNHAPQYHDNAGVVRVQQKIIQDGEAHFPIDFPVERFKIASSMNPGFFVCNHLCAKMAVARARDPSLPIFGFIHVPRSDLTQVHSTESCARAILEGLKK